jgi:hypothetical protein
MNQEKSLVWQVLSIILILNYLLVLRSDMHLGFFFKKEKIFTLALDINVITLDYDGIALRNVCEKNYRTVITDSRFHSCQEFSARLSTKITQLLGKKSTVDSKLV